MNDQIRRAEEFCAANYHPLPIILERGEGAFVWDVEGRKYTDMLSAYSALNQGHRHPRVIEALNRQAGRLTLTSRAFHNDRLGPFLQRLCEISGYEKALPMNTGAEAVETAIKAARKWGYQHKDLPPGAAEIVVFEGNFHGRTTTITGFSSEALYREGFGPFAPGFRTIPYGDIDALKAALSDRTVAVLIEPIQGEAGVVVPPEGFLSSVRKLCQDNQVLMLADEIQTGLGRTGRMFASDWEEVRPDILIVGKALGAGVIPVSAILADREIMDVFTPGTHGSTFGGNPLAAAVGLEALNVIVEEELAERADELGTWFMDELRNMDAPPVESVRGKGLLIGVVIRESAGPARPFCEALMERGILAKETQRQVIRFAPPLVIERSHLRELLPQIREVLCN